MFFKRIKPFAFWVGLLLLASCYRSPFNQLKTAGLTKFDSTTTETSSKINELINPYKMQIDSQMAVVVGFTALEMDKAKPEGLLGNAVSKLLLDYAKDELGVGADLCIMNNGGLRTPLPKGAITKGKIFELMPFDNMLVVVDLPYAELPNLAKHILNKGGEPFCGFEKVQLIQEGNEAKFSFASDMYAKRSHIKILTSDYLANGGDGYEVLTKATQRTELNVLIRDALIFGFQTYSSESKPLEAKIEGKVILNQ